MSTIMKISHMSQQKELEDKGFKVQVTKENNDDVEKGNVISQSPKDKTVDEGSTILLVVSKGEKSDEKTMRRTRIQRLKMRLLKYRIPVKKIKVKK